MIGERILNRAEKRILGGWARLEWKVRVGDSPNGVNFDGGGEYAYCLTGAIGFTDDGFSGHEGPGMRVVTDALYAALPCGWHYPPAVRRESRYRRLMDYNDDRNTSLESILGTIQRAKALLPQFQPGADNPEGSKTSTVAA